MLYYISNSDQQIHNVNDNIVNVIDEQTIEILNLHGEVIDTVNVYDTLMSLIDNMNL